MTICSNGFRFLSQVSFTFYIAYPYAHCKQNEKVEHCAQMKYQFQDGHRIEIFKLGYRTPRFSTPITVRETKHESLAAMDTAKEGHSRHC